MKFKVFQGSSTDSPGYYFHVVSSNGKITLPSEAYPTKAHAFRAVDQVWRGFAKALGMPLSARLLLPLTRDSLQRGRG